MAGYPDAVLGADAADPATIVAARESTRLAFVAALQHLPAKQRVVLILRDVLKWRAAEVAELLDTSTAAVNSALQRARAQLERDAPARDELVELTDPAQRELLERYAKAFEDADITGLIELFKKDVVWEMPPFPEWFVGADVVVRLILAQCGPARATSGWSRRPPTRSRRSGSTCATRRACTARTSCRS